MKEQITERMCRKYLNEDEHDSSERTRLIFQSLPNRKMMFTDPEVLQKFLSLPQIGKDYHLSLPSCLYLKKHYEKLGDLKTVGIISEIMSKYHSQALFKRSEMQKRYEGKEPPAPEDISKRQQAVLWHCVKEDDDVLCMLRTTSKLNLPGTKFTNSIEDMRSYVEENQINDTIAIPRTDRRNPVTIIETNGLRRSVVKRVIFPDSFIREIRNGAFADSLLLEDIEIPSSVQSIGNYAFMNCRSLKSIVIPNSVREMGEECFRGCTALEVVILPAHLKEIPRKTFFGCTALRHVLISPETEKIGERSFVDTNVKEMLLPKELKIDHTAFNNPCKVARVDDSILIEMIIQTTERLSLQKIEKRRTE